MPRSVSRSLAAGSLTAEQVLQKMLLYTPAQDQL
jgi:hypothetical protein